VDLTSELGAISISLLETAVKLGFAGAEPERTIATFVVCTTGASQRDEKERASTFDALSYDSL
jgi:hypothetical protein